jgi:predicted NUDIX family NTP pyrophosphohydrolase
MIYAWAVESDLNLDNFSSNTFEMEWPLRSGKKKQFPEVDRAEWFTLEEAKKKINQGQVLLLTELENMKI